MGTQRSADAAGVRDHTRGAQAGVVGCVATDGGGVCDRARDGIG